MEIGIISDTHSYLDPVVLKAFANVDEVWHAGDFGTMEVAQSLARFKPMRGVYGNIDDVEIREQYPEDLFFEIEGVSVWMTHIAGRPGRYDRRVAQELRRRKGKDAKDTKKPELPNLLICGHSHILHVECDKKYNSMQFLNPGAAGHQGFHAIRTLLKCTIETGQVKNLRVIELGPRGRKLN